MVRQRGRRREPDNLADDEAAIFQTYFEYNRVLRTWFVAFGIGGPALFLVNGAVAQRLVEAHRLKLVVILFLAGAGAQVVGALINKMANWYVYKSLIDEDAQTSGFHRFAGWLSEQFWIDVLVDICTIAAFGSAAWVLFTVFATA
jgi:hypothetical protein